MNHRTNRAKINLYRRFNEGSELGDAVGALLDAASTMDGLGMDHETQLSLVIVEKIILDYYKLGSERGLPWFLYDEIDAKLYHKFIGERKMSKKEYEVEE